MRRVLCLGVLLLGCESFDPVGAYSGDATVSGQFQTALTRPDAEGRLDVNSTSASQSRSGVTVTVRRTGESRLELTLDDGCVVPLQQSPEPNEHNTTVAFETGATCPVQLEGYTGPVTLGGTVTFGREDRSIDVAVHGNVPPPPDPDAPGATYGSWAYSLRGTRPEG